MTELSVWFKNTFFARHETFCPRYNWLKKGFDGVSDNSKIFDLPDAIERLGVGKNMVRAMRFWCMAFKIIKPVIDTNPLRVGGEMRTTNFGRLIFADDSGWDPYVEDIATLWLLHWQLFVPSVIATSWPLIMNANLLGNFSANDITNAIVNRIAQEEKFKRFSTSSIEKDVSCFLRMYSFYKERKTSEIECPFTNLHILGTSGSKQDIQFNNDDKLSLPNSIFLASCFHYAAITQSKLKTLSLHKIIYGFNSPGVIFKLSESDVGRRLEDSVRGMEDVSFVESYGNRQLQFDKSPMELCHTILKGYYSKGI